MGHTRHPGGPGCMHMCLAWLGWARMGQDGVQACARPGSCPGSLRAWAHYFQSLNREKVLYHECGWVMVAS